MSILSQNYDHFLFHLNNYFDFVDAPDGSKLYLKPKDIIEENPLIWCQVLHELGYLDDDLITHKDRLQDYPLWFETESFTSDMEDYISSRVLIETNCRYGVYIANLLENAFSDILAEYNGGSKNA